MQNADKKDARCKHERKGKIKTEPETRIASRLSLVRVMGVEPTRLAAQEPKSCASANSAIPVYAPTAKNPSVLFSKRCRPGYHFPCRIYSASNGNSS